MTRAVAETDWLPPAIECDAKGYICAGRNLTVLRGRLLATSDYSRLCAFTNEG